MPTFFFGRRFAAISAPVAVSPTLRDVVKSQTSAKSFIFSLVSEHFASRHLELFPSSWCAAPDVCNHDEREPEEGGKQEEVTLAV